MSHWREKVVTWDCSTRTHVAQTHSIPPAVPLETVEFRPDSKGETVEKGEIGHSKVVLD